MNNFNKVGAKFHPSHPRCEYGPCEVPQCCENGIAVRVSNMKFGHMQCPDRGCFSCLSQQYLLGVHERCSLDHTLMKSLCAPGLSCMIYCSKDIEGIQSCWNRYGTCQHDHVPGVAAQQFPGNVTIIPGLTMNDAKRAPICTRERTICHCRTSTCESTGTKEKPWCFLSNLRNPNNPTQNCYMDVRWSATYGSFYSHEACIRLRNRRQIPQRSSSSQQLNLRSGVESQVPVLGNFDTVADQQLTESSSTPTVVNPSTSPSTNPPKQNLPQQNLPEQNLPQQNSPQQNLPQHILPPQNLPQQNSPQQNLPQQNSPQQNPPQQNLLQQNSPQQNPAQQTLPQQNLPQQNSPQQNPPQQNLPQQNLPPLPSENDFYWNFEEESGQEPAAAAGTVNNGGGGGAGGSAGQVQVVNEPKKMEAKELLS
eukprot:06727.XXX_78127_79702_1 [CDS] Oithona nana genome sequencing.